MAKKTYNPLKMFGSWIGVFLALSLEITRVILVTNGNYELGNKITYLFFPIIKPFNFLISLGSTPINITPFLLVGIYGFLVGWGIHSLIRASR